MGIYLITKFHFKLPVQILSLNLDSSYFRMSLIFTSIIFSADQVMKQSPTSEESVGATVMSVTYVVTTFMHHKYSDILKISSLSVFKRLLNTS